MSVRTMIDQSLTIIGVIIIVVPLSLMMESWTPLFTVLIGLSLVGLGVWRLGTRLLPDRRVYLGLRSEVDAFIGLVRELNEHARVGRAADVDRVRSEMKESVDRMVLFAGRTEAEI